MLYNDAYNAGVFVLMWQSKVKWCSNLGGWFVYNERYWECDRNGFIKHYAIKAYEKLLEDLRNYQVETEQDKKNLELFSRHVKTTGNDGKLCAMLELSKPYLGDLAENFDKNPNLFNCANKTLDLENKKARDFEQTDMITKNCHIEFVPGAECPTWRKFLHDIFLGDDELIEFFQRAIGYSMTTSTKEHCMFILHGVGRNGKTVLIETIRQLFGDYAEVCPPGTLLRKTNGNEATNDVAALKGSRFVTAVENNENVTLDEALIKKLTGSDQIKARFLYHEGFKFTPTFKIFMATNHRPNIRGTDIGIWRRIRLIPFKFQITDANDDRNLQDKLKSEMPGILLWAIEGYKKWAEFGLPAPDVVKDATLGYQTEEDDLGQFIEDYFKEDHGSGVPLAAFKQRFKECMGYNKSGKSINEYMTKRGFTQGRLTLDGTQVRCWMGIRMLSNWETRV